MGVQGLTSLLHSRSKHAQAVDLVVEAGKKKPHGSAGRRANPAASAAHISDEAETHTSRLLRCFARDPATLFVLVDGLGVFHDLTHVDAVTARALPAYDVLHARVTGWVESLRSAGVELIVYFDTSSTETTKRETILRRAEGRVSLESTHTRHSASALVSACNIRRQS